MTGSARPRAHGPVASIGVDSWAVDYGLLDAFGGLVGPVHAYRSTRTDRVMDAVGRRIGVGHLYGITGTQFLPFNTIYQLVAARETVEYTTAAFAVHLLAQVRLVLTSLSFTGLSELLTPVLEQATSSLAAPRRRALEIALLLVEPGDDLRMRTRLGWPCSTCSALGRARPAACCTR